MERIVVPLHSLLESRDAPTVLVDRNYGIVAANKAYCDSYKIPVDEVVGKKCYEVSHHSLTPCHLNGESCPHQEVFATSQPCEVLHTHYDHENRPDHVRIRAHPIHDSKGQMYLMESINRLSPRIEINSEEMRLTGKSPAFLRFFEEIAMAAKARAPIWLFGESGVGKELAARFLHQNSARASKPYVDLNCAAIPESLCESELFGHEKGAFTGGLRAKRGLFELADGGTLFLDEIGDLPLSMQGKLLRVLDSGEYRRLGSEHIQKCDVRVVAATNKDLAQLVCDGAFRQDLFYRIAGFKVTIPTLRERRPDIPGLARILLNYITRDTGVVYETTHEAMEKLLAHDYPGNIRELRSVLIKASARCRDGIILPADIDFDALPGCGCIPAGPELRHGPALQATADFPVASSVPTIYRRRRSDHAQADNVANTPARQSVRRNTDHSLETELTLARNEELRIKELLEQFGNRRVVSQKLGISERTLYRKMKKYGCDTQH